MRLKGKHVFESCWLWEGVVGGCVFFFLGCRWCVDILGDISRLGSECSIVVSVFFCQRAAECCFCCKWYLEM